MTAAGIQSLVIQPQLKELEFEFVNDEMFRAMTLLRHLESLELRNPYITDVAVENLATIPTLCSLLLAYEHDERLPPAKLTDTALDSLARCATLKELWLRGDWFSDEAVERLRQALPECKIDVRSKKPAPQQEPAQVE